MKVGKTLKRSRVNRALASIFDYPLTIVEAPIGYGKTTAVREFLASAKVPFLWLSFLCAEDTTSLFWNKFALEIEKIDPSAGSRLKSLGFPADAPQTATILSILSDIDFEKNTVFVIDDFHYAKGKAIGTLLDHIIRESPRNLHIVVVTRDTTNLAVAELLSKGLCNVMPQQLLKFTENEIMDYCALVGFVPIGDTVKRVAEYTDGWISLIYLVLLGTEKGIPVGRNTVIDDLVEKVLFHAYSEPVREFLIKLSVTESFTAEQAAFITCETRAEEYLKKLRKENTFVSFLEAEGTYKIHNVLLDFLRTKQRANDTIRECYLRAGQWCLKQKDFTSAYACFYRADEPERILSLLNDESNITKELAEFDGWQEMFKKTPHELLFRYPLAYLQYLSSLLFTKGEDPDGTLTNRLNEFNSYLEERNDLPASMKTRILAEINVAKIFTVFNDVEKMFAFCNMALELLNGGHSYMIRRDCEFTFGSPHFLYSYFTEAGSLEQLACYMSNQLPSVSVLVDGCGTGSEYLVIAEHALESGDWQAAELNALKAMYKAKTKKQTGISICAKFTLIRLYIYLGRISEGRELLKQMRTEVYKENNPIYNTTVELVAGYVYCSVYRSNDVPQWLRSGDMSPVHLLFQGMGFNYIVYGKAVLLDKKYVELEILIESFDRFFSVMNNRLGFLHTRIIEAVVKYNLYGLESGCAALHIALEMGRTDHLILPFAEYAPAIIGMLRHITHDVPNDEYLNEVLRSSRQYLKSLKLIPQNAVSLSTRELEILALAVEGLKRDEIACRLGISTGTVRTHLQHIYQKLEVNGKTSAIKKAKELMLI